MPKNGFFLLVHGAGDTKGQECGKKTLAAARSEPPQNLFRTKQLPPASPLPWKQNTLYDAAPPTVDSRWKFTKQDFPGQLRLRGGDAERVRGNAGSWPRGRTVSCWASPGETRTEQGRPCFTACSRCISDLSCTIRTSSCTSRVLFFP